MLKLVRDKMKAMVGVVKLDDKAKVTQVVPETVTQEDLRDDVDIEEALKIFNIPSLAQVSDAKVAWSTKWDSYAPVPFTASPVVENDRLRKAGGWAAHT